jgi:16S rRNA (guanine1516-N2)-methyltransferase
MPDQNLDVNINANTVILIEDSGSLRANEAAQALGKSLGLSVHTIPANKKKQRFAQAQWQLVFTEKGLSLRLSSEPSWSDIFVDFASSALQYRKANGGGRNESIAKAIGIKGKQQLNVLDCTAGMGTDSFVMASVGANVSMIERSPIIAALLDDALTRAQEVGLDVCERMRLIQRDAISHLQNHDAVGANIDVIYLDPMFPHKKKSALVKKEMQAFQRLLGPDQDSEQLLTSAIDFGAKRIVVKRPASAPELANDYGKKPSAVISSKKHRFDIYLSE